MPGPLDGVRVLEFSEVIAAPFAGMVLADMGADVIKVEPPWGESWRLFRQFIPLESRVYMAVNRGKRSLPLDLLRSDGRAIVYKLLPDIDVVLINYRPDVPQKLGIDYEALSARNPGIIYCEASAYGSSGPQSRVPGYDIIVQAMSGLMASEGKLSAESGVPLHGFTPVVDISTGLSMASAICAALYVRERTGRGQKIEAALLATALRIQGSRFLCVEATDSDGQRAMLEEVALLKEQGVPYSEVQAHYQAFHALPQGNIYYRTYKTRDGVLAVGCLSDALSLKLLSLLGLRDTRFDPGYRADSPEALASGERLTAEAERLFEERTTAEWLAMLDEAGLPSGPVRFTEELLEDEQVIANEMVVELEHQLAGKLRMAGPLVKMSETPLEARSASPSLGQHTDEILKGLGYSPEQIRRLRELGITR